MSDWSVEPLGSVAEIRTSNVDKKSNPSEKPVRLCNYMDIYSCEYITEDIEFMEATATPAEIQRFSVKRGDVLITKDSETPDDIGIPTVVVDEIDNLVCGYHVALIKPDRDKVDSIYLAKQLATIDTARYFGRLANGSTRYGLANKSIADTPIRLAPLPQQQRIAEILSTIDEAIEQTEALIAKTQQIKTGLMHDLVTRGVTKDGQFRPPRAEAPQLYKESPLGWIPKEWEVRELGEVATKISDGEHLSPIFVEYGVPLISAKDVHPHLLDFSTVRFIGEEAAQKALARCDPQYGDLLVVSRGATIGRVHLISTTTRFALMGSVIQVRPNVMIYPSYLEFFLRLRSTQDELVRTSGSSAQQAIYLAHIKHLKVLSPPTPEQSLIGMMLGSAESSLTEESTFRDKLVQTKEGLMHDLLTGRVRVQVEHSEETTN